MTAANESPWCAFARIACALGAWALAITMIGAPGCQARALVPSADDPLREEIRSLQSQVARLEQSNKELQVKLAAAENPHLPAPEVRAQIPVPVRMKFGWGNQIDRLPDGRGRLIAYVETLDGRDRFVPAVGWLDVSVFSMPAAPAQPEALGERSLNPEELRDRFRTGFSGPHYTVDIPIELAAASRPVMVRATFRDGLTGQVLESTTVVAPPR